MLNFAYITTACYWALRTRCIFYCSCADWNSGRSFTDAILLVFVMFRVINWCSAVAYQPELRYVKTLTKSFTRCCLCRHAVSLGSIAVKARRKKMNTTCLSAALSLCLWSRGFSCCVADFQGISDTGPGVDASRFHILFFALSHFRAPESEIRSEIRQETPKL